MEAIDQLRGQVQNFADEQQKENKALREFIQQLHERDTVHVKAQEALTVQHTEAHQD